MQETEREMEREIEFLRQRLQSMMLVNSENLEQISKLQDKHKCLFWEKTFMETKLRNL